MKCDIIQTYSLILTKYNLDLPLFMTCMMFIGRNYIIFDSFEMGTASKSLEDGERKNTLGGITNNLNLGLV